MEIKQIVEVSELKNLFIRFFPLKTIKDYFPSTPLHISLRIFGVSLIIIAIVLILFAFRSLIKRRRHDYGKKKNM